jgi:hypothetical protein
LEQDIAFGAPSFFPCPIFGADDAMPVRTKEFQNHRRTPTKKISLPPVRIAYCHRISRVVAVQLLAARRREIGAIVSIKTLDPTGIAQAQMVEYHREVAARRNRFFPPGQIHIARSEKHIPG